MASDRPHDSTSFESLWDFDLEEGKDEGLPPALDPNALRVPLDKRDTVQPPVPHPDYVQSMMELSELDDPTSHDRKTPTGRPLDPRSPGAMKSASESPAARFGLVMATEHELLLPVVDPPAPESLPSRTSKAPPSPRLVPPLPMKPPARSGGFRPAASLAGRGAPVIPGAPVPRAPSVPPPPPDEEDPLAGLESLDAPDAPESPPPAILVGHRAGALARQSSKPPARELAPRMTPPTIPPPRERRTTSSGGLRLLRQPEPVFEATDRITPVAIDLGPVSLDMAPTPIDESPNSVIDQVREMQQRFEAKNYGGALVLAESVLISDPDHTGAKRTADSCRELLGEKYLGSLGGRRSVPRVAMPPEEMRFLSLDHRAGFLLSFIDGSMSVEEVLDVSSMPELEALRIMFELRQQGVIELEVPAPRRR
ncbi:TPR domain protein [Minicystis rosea]|nr:TPR domain protein [Minicystis rosea]